MLSHLLTRVKWSIKQESPPAWMQEAYHPQEVARCWPPPPLTDPPLAGLTPPGSWTWSPLAAGPDPPPTSWTWPPWLDLTPPCQLDLTPPRQLDLTPPAAGPDPPPQQLDLTPPWQLDLTPPPPAGPHPPPPPPVNKLTKWNYNLPSYYVRGR